jgi:hypothetical protein
MSLFMTEAGLKMVAEGIVPKELRELLGMEESVLVPIPEDSQTA